MTDEPLETLKEAAHYLGVSVKTVRRLIKDGKLPFHRIGGQLRVAPTDRRAYMAATRRAGQP